MDFIAFLSPYSIVSPRYLGFGDGFGLSLVLGPGLGVAGHPLNVILGFFFSRAQSSLERSRASRMIAMQENESRTKPIKPFGVFLVPGRAAVAIYAGPELLIHISAILVIRVRSPRPRRDPIVSQPSIRFLGDVEITQTRAARSGSFCDFIEKKRLRKV